MVCIGSQKRLDPVAFATIINRKAGLLDDGLTVMQRRKVSRNGKIQYSLASRKAMLPVGNQHEQGSWWVGPSQRQHV